MFLQEEQKCFSREPTQSYIVNITVKVFARQMNAKEVVSAF